jgi:hypothetical protein
VGGSATKRTRGPCIFHVPHTRTLYHAFGVIGAALSKKIGIFQSSALKAVPISPKRIAAVCKTRGPRTWRLAPRARAAAPA